MLRTNLGRSGDTWIRTKKKCSKLNIVSSWTALQLLKKKKKTEYDKGGLVILVFNFNFIPRVGHICLKLGPI
jgi:hypothetical protein